MTGHLSKTTAPAWAMLGIGLLVTILGGFQVKQAVERDATVQFAFICDQVALKIHERLGAYALILRGGAGLFAASDAVERHEWTAYVDTLRAGGSVPGVEGIGFAQAIAPGQLAAHTAQIRAEGFPQYKIYPAGERALYTSIIYLEPFRGRNLRAFGYDMFSEPVRRAAMELARDTGDATLSGKVQLVQENGIEVQAGTLIYVPVYHRDMPKETLEQRRAALIGWSYSPYRMNDFITGILHEWGHQEGRAVDLQIYDGLLGAPAALLFDSKPAHAFDPSSLFHQTRTISFNGHDWTLAFDRVSKLSAVIYTPVWFSLAGGISLSTMIFFLALSIAHTKTNALRIAENLTKQVRQREELLKESEFRWKFALEGARDGLWDWDVPTGTVFFSTRWKEMLGFAEDEIGNGLDEWSKRVHPDDLARALEGVQAHLDGTTPFYVNEHRVSCKDGSWKWILDRGLVVSRDAEGKPIRVIGTHSDISERKQIEEALSASEARFKLIFNEAPLGIALIDSLTGHIYSVNPMLAKIAGRTVEEMTHIDWMSITHPDDVQEELNNMALLNAGKIAGFQTEKRYLHRDGTTVWIHMTIAPVHVEDKAHPRHLCMIEDISERKQLEDQVREMAFHDTLTKLPNRRLLKDRLNQTLAAHKRSGFRGAMMFLDLDNFKSLNDTHGHEVGDLLLIEAADRLKRSVRAMDTVARFGGDEFVVMISELGADESESVAQARIIAEKIRAALGEPYILKVRHEGQPETTIQHHCTASIGVALFSHKDIIQEEVLERADKMMYQAKEAGRNLVRFYETKA